MNIGVTGHQRLRDNTAWAWVELQIEQFLRRVPAPITGLSSLAIGADQLFAAALLRRGGTLDVIVPFQGYEDQFVSPVDRAEYKVLISKARSITVLPRVGSDEDCYYAAGKAISDKADVVVAVWDGLPPKGLGGTADIVAYALNLPKTVLHINPIQLTVVEIG